MEEEAGGGAGAGTLYDDYRFVTRDDLDRLGLTRLVGTPALRAYMHGFFIDNRLYAKAQAIAAPFSYEAYREKKARAGAHRGALRH